MINRPMNASNVKKQTKHLLTRIFIKQINNFVSLETTFYSREKCLKRKIKYETDFNLKFVFKVELKAVLDPNSDFI